jgi:hypothetical protein
MVSSTAQAVSDLHRTGKTVMVRFALLFWHFNWRLARQLSRVDWILANDRGTKRTGVNQDTPGDLNTPQSGVPEPKHFGFPDHHRQ